MPRALRGVARDPDEDDSTFTVVSPGDGAVAVAWLIGLYAIMFGVTLIALGLRLRGQASGAGPRLA